MKLPWKRLIRFQASDGRILRGEPILPTEDFDLGFVKESDDLEAKVIIGDDMYDTTGKTVVSDEVVKVKKLLGPLAQEDVPILRCVGLNYAKHSQYLSFSRKEYMNANRLCDRFSQGSRQITPAVSFYLFQAKYLRTGSRRGGCDSEDLSGRSS